MRDGIDVETWSYAMMLKLFGFVRWQNHSAAKHPNTSSILHEWECNFDPLKHLDMRDGIDRTICSIRKMVHAWLKLFGFVRWQNHSDAKHNPNHQIKQE